MSPSPPDRTPEKTTRDTTEKPLSLAAIRRVSELLKLASQPYRLDILRILDGGPRTVSDLCKGFPGVTDQFVSRHLSSLRAGGLVDNRTDGAFRVYSLTERGKRLVEAVGGLDLT